VKTGKQSIKKRIWIK